MRYALMVIIGLAAALWCIVPQVQAEKEPMVAWANLEPTSPDGTAKGEVRIFQIYKGLRIVGNISGAPPGKHGIHIHEKGDCGDSGNASGGHYNPHGRPHGYVPKDKVTFAHVGDMGNVSVDKSGHGDFSVDIIGISISEYDAIAGRAIILHEKEDDFGQPTGNAGGRIACGIIETEQQKAGEEAPAEGK